MVTGFLRDAVCEHLKWTSGIGIKMNLTDSSSYAEA